MYIFMEIFGLDRFLTISSVFLRRDDRHLYKRIRLYKQHFK